MPEALAVRVRRGARASTHRPHPATAVLAALMLLSAAVLLYAGRHLTFFYDEWNFILTRRGESVGTYLDPHNGHLSLFPVVVYKVLFKLVGLRHYTPYQVVLVVLHLLGCGLLYVLARRRIGPWLALLPATLLLFMGTAWQDLLWPFQMGYLGSIAGGLGAMALLDRGVAPRDGLAMALLIWSMASSSVGIPFLLACAVLLLVSRQPWRRFWVVAVPAALYVLWYIGWGTSEQTTRDAILAAPQYVANAASGAAAGIAGLDDTTWGPALALALFGAVTVGWHARRRGAPTPMLLAAAVGALLFWLLTAVVRADAAEPDASRYVYVGAFFIMLIVAEACLGLGTVTPWFALAAVLVLGAVISNINALRSGEEGMRAADASVRASLAAVQIAAPVVSPAFSPNPGDAPQITAGPYLAAVRALGSPALTLGELERAPETIRLGADGVLEQAEAIHESQLSGPVTGAAPVSVTGESGGQATPRGMCQVFRPTAAGAYVDIQVTPGSQVLLGAKAGPGPTVYLRRFASDFGPPPLTPGAGASGALIAFPDDRAPTEPWELRIAPSRIVEICVR